VKTGVLLIWFADKLPDLRNNEKPGTCRSTSSIVKAPEVSISRWLSANWLAPWSAAARRRFGNRAEREVN